MTLVPHISTGTIWKLGKKLSEATNTKIHVMGSLPAITKLANNKLQFGKFARSLFGENAVPKEVIAFNATSLVSNIMSFMKRYAQLVVKLPDSAGSAGNLPIDCKEILGRSPLSIHRYLARQLEALNIAPRYPMIVQVWENSVLCSPSIQLWIPNDGEAVPIIEGIFEQHLSGPAGQFSGGITFSKYDEIAERMCREGAMLGRVLQKLGYFGRCSFDAIVSGNCYEEADLHWIECNGRWGGMSIPLTLLNRLFPDHSEIQFMIGHWADLDLAARPMSESLGLIEDLLWQPGKTSGIIFLTPSIFETGRNMQFLSIAETSDLAEENAQSALARLKSAS